MERKLRDKTAVLTAHCISRRQFAVGGQVELEFRNAKGELLPPPNKHAIEVEHSAWKMFTPGEMYEVRFQEIDHGSPTNG